MLEIINKTKWPIKEKTLKNLSRQVLSFYKLDDYSLNLILIGPDRMRGLNRRYRRQDKSTDVLSFPSSNIDKVLADDKFLGEIFINRLDLNRIAKYREVFQFLEQFSKLKNADRAKNLSQEYIFYSLFIHGLLHLIGYQDKSEAERLAMIEIGEMFLNQHYKNFAKL